MHVKIESGSHWEAKSLDKSFPFSNVCSSFASRGSISVTILQKLLHCRKLISSFTKRLLRFPGPPFSCLVQGDLLDCSCVFLIHLTVHLLHTFQVLTALASFRSLAKRLQHPHVRRSMYGSPVIAQIFLDNNTATAASWYGSCQSCPHCCWGVVGKAVDVTWLKQQQQL